MPGSTWCSAFRAVTWSRCSTAAVVGDARRALAQVCAALPATHEPGDGVERVRLAHEACGTFEVAASASAAVPIMPQRVIAELVAALPHDGVITADAGENRIFLVHHLRTGAAGGFLQPGSTGGMGYAVPAALGVKLAFPERAVVAVAGDGGFGMSLAGLLTARELGLAVVVVVLDNAMLGWVPHVQGDRRIASDLGAFDYAAIARAAGCGGRRVTEPGELGDALGEALAADRPFVLDVVTAPDPSWRDVRSSLAAGGAAAVPPHR
jgi:acetolactate synthase-1/2/3 large subunit